MIAFAVPANGDLIGTAANGQFAVFDAGGNALALVFSDGFALLFGG